MVLPACDHASVLGEAAAGIQVSWECRGASMVKPNIYIRLL